MSPNLEASFWVRMGLREDDRDICIKAVEEVFPGRVIREFENQGYCSFTLFISRLEQEEDDYIRIGPADKVFRPTHSEFLVQIRPQQHSLDLSIVHAARTTYGAFAPNIRSLDCSLPGRLRAFEIEFLEGISLPRSRPQSQSLDTQAFAKQVNLIESFASFLARAWPSSQDKATEAQHARADSPVFDGPGWRAKCTGNVGANIISKLKKLTRELPSQRLRERTQDILDRLLAVIEYPVVLCHGDLIPSNMLIDERTWEVSGIVDWAEAEWLPFGTPLYGLEHLLGFLGRASGENRHTKPQFTYYEEAPILRRFFWDRVLKEKPDVKERLEDVLLMRDVGVLLWFGYAWDEGKIDRVVNKEDDADEVAYLEAFLGL